MDIDRLQPTRPKVHKPVGYSLRTKDSITGMSVDDLFADKEARTSLDDDERLVVGMNMKGRPLSRGVIAVGENG